MESLGFGEEITVAKVMIGISKTERQAKLLGLGLPACLCHRCRLDSDKDIDYKEWEEIFTKNMSYLRYIGHKDMNRFYKLFDYKIDFQLILYFEEIYGQNCTVVSEILVLSFLFFALYSRHSSIPLIKMWYQMIEPRVVVTHGSDHPIYKLLEKVFHYSTVKLL